MGDHLPHDPIALPPHPGLDAAERTRGVFMTAAMMENRTGIPVTKKDHCASGDVPVSCEKYHGSRAVWSFWPAISEPGRVSRKKVPLAVLLESTRPNYAIFFTHSCMQTRLSKKPVPGVFFCRDKKKTTGGDVGCVAIITRAAAIPLFEVGLKYGLYSGIRSVATPNGRSGAEH